MTAAKTYRIYYTCTSVYFTDIQAENLEDAEEQADSCSPQGLDLQLSSTNDWEVMDITTFQ